MTLAPGTQLGPYEILTLLGTGGMGEVYRARDLRLGRDVAIKVSNERFSDRFQQEARAVAALNHPNICTLYDVGPNYLVMEYIEGAALKGPFSSEKARSLALQIASALVEAHHKRIIHRDLKPTNILLTGTGVKRSIECFQQAIEEDPDFALAYAGLADCHATHTVIADAHPTDVFPTARAAAVKALAIDPTLVEAHATLMHVNNLYDWDWAAVERAYARTQERSPNYAMAHF